MNKRIIYETKYFFTFIENFHRIEPWQFKSYHKVLNKELDDRFLAIKRLSEYHDT